MSMKNKELIAKLSDFDPEAEVLIPEPYGQFDKPATVVVETKFDDNGMDLENGSRAMLSDGYEPFTEGTPVVIID